MLLVIKKWEEILPSSSSSSNNFISRSTMCAIICLLDPGKIVSVSPLSLYVLTSAKVPLVPAGTVGP